MVRPIAGLSIGLDWYDIRLRDAINTPDANTIASLCVDQATLDNAYCNAISRERGTGFINGYVVQPQNVAAFRTAGAELNIAYRFRRARAGAFDIRQVGGYLDKLEQSPRRAPSPGTMSISRSVRNIPSPSRRAGRRGR
ncbi:hypothetical protein U1708_16955 [Sphingomonas sp. ZB1N12]|uniref:hypothetical protein n=1 Tax=Sphingomonas arabinosi TaxID=3096160 RepID=UPI002FCB1691